MTDLANRLLSMAATFDVVSGIRDSRDARTLRQAAAEIAALQSPTDELLEALREARDLLLERIQGSPARSAGHNARLVIQAAIAKFGGDS